jgi:hypothetical protein
MKHQIKIYVFLMVGAALFVAWGCGTTRSGTSSNAVLPQSHYPDYAQISFVDHVSPNADVVQSNMVGVVSANAVVKIYNDSLVLVAQGTAAANGSFSVTLGNNLDFNGEDNLDEHNTYGIYKDTVYLTTTTPGFSESLSTFVKVGGWQ